MCLFLYIFVCLFNANLLIHTPVQLVSNRWVSLQAPGGEAYLLPVPVCFLGGSLLFRISDSFSASQMNRGPFRPQRSPGAPRPAGRFPSPGSSWGFPGARSPYGGSGHRGASPRGCGAYSPGSPVYSPGSGRGYWDGSPVGFGSGSRCFPGQMRSRGDGFRRPQSFSPGSAQKFPVGSRATVG